MNAARFDLDGTWEFLHVSSDQPGPASVRSIEVPSPWQAQFRDLSRRGGIGIYRREFVLPVGFPGDRIFLRFGAVFHHASVWVNGVAVGSHEGGFLPFSFDVTDQLVSGVNELKVRVESPTDDPEEFPHAPFSEIPFGKQSWYGPLSGIWQSVFLERRIAEHLAGLRVFSELATGAINVKLWLAAPLKQPGELRLDIIDPDGVVSATSARQLEALADRTIMETAVRHVRPWSPARPELYKARITLRCGGARDCIEGNFGFRTIDTRHGKLFLNGEPLYLRAALDQDYYPDTICTLPSLTFVEDQFRKAKELGLNCLRCHIKAPDPRYYEAADRIGLLIWAELPNGGLSTERSRSRKELTLKGIVDRDGNHPSIICWTLINENWGVDLVHDRNHRRWLKDLYTWLKAYDTSRLVVDNSPLAPSFHLQTDLADYHFYAAFPDSRADWDSFVEELAGRPPWLFSQEGDAVTTGDEPLLCSEFGNWGLPRPADLVDASGREPWWFETGHDWGEGVMYPHGIEDRFSDWSLDRVFGSLDDFVTAAQWQQFRALKYQIESIRRRPELAGYVITELTDCHWESNGLLDMRRNRRVFHDAFHHINSEIVIAPRWERLSFWAGERVPIEFAVANGSSGRIDSAVLDIGHDRQQLRVEVPPIEPLSVANISPVELQVPDCGAMARVQCRLVSATGERIARNFIDLAVHPSRNVREALRLLPVWSPDADIAERLQALGYNTVPSLDRASLAWARDHTPELADYVRKGGRLVLAAEHSLTLYPFFPHWQNVKVVDRRGTPWRGDWASSFAWLRRRGIFARLPGGPLLDETFDRVIPSHVISGCNLLDFQSRVHGGLAVGWIHKPVALLVHRSYGDGLFVASTFRLFRDAPGADPTATVLLDSLVELAMMQRVHEIPAPAA